MNDIAREHEKIDPLLAWYVNGSLEHDEIVRIEAHAEHCEECRDSIDFLQQLEAHVTAATSEDEAPRELPEALRNRIGASSRRTWPAALAASIVVAFALGLGGGLLLQDTSIYRTATTPVDAGAERVQLELRFTSDTSVEEFGRFVREHQAIISSGPGPDGWYRMELANPQRLDAEGLARQLARTDGIVAIKAVDSDREDDL